MKQVHKFKVFKINKHDTIYEGLQSNNLNSFVTQFVKIEKFQGYSNAFNLGLYLRVKDQSSWSKSKKVTGLWKTNRKNVYYGDLKDKNFKTLLLVRINPETNELFIYEFQRGYYPSRQTIETLSLTL